MKQLVVYYSRKGYTESVALDIAKKENADFLEIETIENTIGWYGFLNCMRLASLGKRAELFPYETNISEYDKVIIVTSVWCSSAAAPMITFLEREKHNIKEAEYVFVHFLPNKPTAAAAKLDKLLRFKAPAKASFIKCNFGHMADDGEEKCDV